MIGDLFNNNRKRDVCTREGQKFYKGEKYAIGSDGYYKRTTGDRKRLHVVVYEEEKLGGECIPDGYIVHHRNGIKTDNRIENLCCITHLEHEMIHNEKDEEVRSEKIIFDFFDGSIVEYR